MNKIQILGTITRDIELRYTQGGSAIANFGIAYNDKWKDQNGQPKEKAHFFDVSAFGKRAETLNQYFRKGQRILIDGSLDFQQWENNGQKHSKVSIKLESFDFIEKNENNQQPQQPQQQQNYQTPQQTGMNSPVQHTQVQQQQPQYQQQVPQQQQQAQQPNAIDVDPNQIPF